ncbi:hypothetical protein G7046_g9556 [Stylonectria norvegica]|nr:hypothetical protein G7046_g9556 [Stylonectria norvegica]
MNAGYQLQSPTSGCDRTPGEFPALVPGGAPFADMQDPQHRELRRKEDLGGVLGLSAARVAKTFRVAYTTTIPPLVGRAVRSSTKGGWTNAPQAAPSATNNGGLVRPVAFLSVAAADQQE